MNSVFKKIAISTMFFTGFAFTTHANDFSAGSNAKEFGFNEEVKATFSAKVVDVLCELTGDCADNCGNGVRQIGLLREADDKLIFVLKNGQFSFNGAAEDLVLYCNKLVDVDGIFVGDPEDYNTQFYMLQFIRDKGAEEWTPAKKWTKAWAKKNPEAAGKGPWFRRDHRVKKQVEATGIFGLGHQVDEEFRKSKEKK